MKKDGLFLGIFLIIIGVFWLLNNLGFIDFTLYDFRVYIERALSLWPLILIIIGVNIATDNTKVKTVVWILALIIIITYMFFASSIDPVLYNLPFSNNMRHRNLF